VRPAVLEDSLPTVLLGRVELHELDQRSGMPHLFCLRQVAAQEATRGTGRKGMGMSSEYALFFWNPCQLPSVSRNS